ncbi:homoprotocatechuate degradation operon regulator HpaR [Paremcibacter congregatus]|uniref:homoprotocatechuate degradation operon regulator HpaR n=1 Tax=Paremcibacter congregatus TaxID=2043170 RepID=UPI0030EED6B0
MTSKNTKRDTTFTGEQLPMRDLAHSLPITLLKGRESIMTDFRAMLLDNKLTDQQWRVLRALAENPVLEVVELAEKCVILQPSVSRIIRKMEERGLITRIIPSRDRRRSEISITPKGRALFAKLAPRCEEIYKEITARFGQEKLDKLLALLHDLSASMKD